MRLKINFRQIAKTCPKYLAGVIMTTATCMALNLKQVQATTINVPKGYTISRVRKADDGTITQKEYTRLVKASINGMKDNDYTSNDQRIVRPGHLSSNDQRELTKFTLSTLNSFRRQLGKRPWKYDRRAQKFANRVAHYYYQDNASCWDSDHDLHAILKVARYSGLNTHIGQAYEDEAGLPITTQYHGQTRPMGLLKKQLYFNLKQMLFGGYAGSNENDPNNYTEYHHAADLLSIGKYEPQYCMFGMSFSELANDPSKISVHMLGVPKRYILNYKKFNH